MPEIVISEGLATEGGAVARQSIDPHCVAAWFAVFTTPRHEKRVAEHFKHSAIEHFLPLYVQTRLWRNRMKVAVELPLFPCYVFARIEWQHRVKVLNVPGVVRFIGKTVGYSPISDEIVEFLQRGVRLGKIQPHANVDIGDRVRITAGPMMGMEGILEQLRNEVRVIVKLDFLMRSVAVEVAINEVERVR